MTEAEEALDDPSGISAQRRSIILAKKAELNVGKDSTQIAHDLLVKKLGELAGEIPDDEEPDFDFYAQHFQRPLELSKMEAIQTLIEQEKKRKRGAQRQQEGERNGGPGCLRASSASSSTNHDIPSM